MAGQVGVADHTVVESGTMIGAQSGIMGHVTKGAYSGSPAIPHRDWLRAQAVYARLPEMQKKIRELEEKIQTLERRNTGMMDIKEIQTLLPHRYPFLLVDRIIQIETGKKAVGIKNVTINEEFFQGHFPDHPIMPGRPYHRGTGAGRG